MLFGTDLYPGIKSGHNTSLVCASIRQGRQLFVALSELRLLLLNKVQVISITTSSPNRRFSYFWRIMFVEGNELSVHSYHTACVFSRFLVVAVIIMNYCSCACFIVYGLTRNSPINCVSSIVFGGEE